MPFVLQRGQPVQHGGADRAGAKQCESHLRDAPG